MLILPPMSAKVNAHTCPTCPMLGFPLIRGEDHECLFSYAAVVGRAHPRSLNSVRCGVLFTLLTLATGANLESRQIATQRWSFFFSKELLKWKLLIFSPAMTLCLPHSLMAWHLVRLFRWFPASSLFCPHDTGPHFTLFPTYVQYLSHNGNEAFSCRMCDVSWQKTCSHILVTVATLDKRGL